MPQTHPSDTDAANRAIIVGGSLGGLSTALALARIGMSSVVLERTTGRTQRGVAIRVGGGELIDTLGDEAASIVADELGRESMRQYTLPHSWWRVNRALRRACDAEPLVSVIEGVTVAEAGEGSDAAWVRDTEGREWNGPLVIGADGYRSVVRRYVASDHPDADYAGYVVWLGQSDIPETMGDPGGPDFFPGAREMLAVYPLIEPNGSVRRFGWGVFDPTRNAVIRSVGAIGDGRVNYTPRPDEIPDRTYDELARSIEQQGPEQWAAPIAEAIRNHETIATPITEYLPEAVVRGRVALVGDSAHAQTPMTGAGFEEAVSDANALSRALDSDGPIASRLLDYQSMRLQGMRSMVSSGRSFSRSFA